MGLISGMLMGLLVGVALMAGWSRMMQRRTRKRVSKAADIKVLGALSRDDLKKLCGDNFPEWISFPQFEQVKWLNKLLSKLWPFVAQAATLVVKESVEPLLDDYRPPGIKSLKFNKFFLGNVSPKIEGIRIQNLQPGQIIMDIDFRWGGDPSIILAVDALVASLPIQLKDLQVFTVVRVVFQLSEEIPCISAVVVALLQEPEPKIQYTLKAVGGSLTAVPGLSDMIDDTVNSIVTDMLQWPHRLVVPLVVNADTSELELKPQGRLSVTVVKSTSLMNMELIGKSDPYVILYVRPMFKVKTKVIDDNLNPDRDFLPRGPDICTRRPLVLQLVRHSAPEEWGEFLHAPGRRFHDFEQIKHEIQLETDQEAGDNKGVSEKQIRLKIFSPNVIDITLVDLPGITRVPVGDQPSDIESRIRTMIMHYIKHQSCIILAVSPANADLANSDALQLARLADPDGSRTIGVITKLDIMDRGTDARNFLLGNVIPLKLGYVGVVNRSQEDINFNRSIKDALAFEKKFFSTLPAYHGLSHCCGVPQLAKKLNTILLKHITDMLPGLKSRINAQLVAVAKEHAAYGDTAESTAGQGVKLLNILRKYCEAFSSMVEGKNKVSTDELSGGARIHYIFQSIFVKSLEEVDPCKNITDEDVRTAIQNSGGPKGAMFLPEVPFEILVRRQIDRLLDPSLQCAKFIYDELVKISHGCLTSELQKYPILKKRMGESVSNFLRDGLRPAETMITHIIKMEMDYINTSHPSFVGGSKVVELAKNKVLPSRAPTSLSVRKDGIAISSEIQLTSEKGQKSRAVFARDATRGATSEQGFQPDTDAGTSAAGGSRMGHSLVGESLSDKSVPRVHSLNSLYSIIQLREPPITLKPSENQTEQDATEVAIVRLLIKSYYDIVRKSIEDAVPKAIMHFLVNHTKRELHNVLIRKLYRENLLDEMLRETDEVIIRRQRIQETLQVLEQAHRTLEEFPLEAEKVDKGYSLAGYATGLPKIDGLSNGDRSGIYTSSSPNFYNSKKESHVDQHAPVASYSYPDANGGHLST